jgi:hypothetical protein
VWSCSVEEIPSLHPSSPQYLVKGQGGVAVGEGSKDDKGVKDSEREKNYGEIPDREKKPRP